MILLPHDAAAAWAAGLGSRGKASIAAASLQARLTRVVQDGGVMGQQIDDLWFKACLLKPQPVRPPAPLPSYALKLTQVE